MAEDFSGRILLFFFGHVAFVPQVDKIFFDQNFVTFATGLIQ